MQPEIITPATDPVARVVEAALFAAEGHRYQKRKDRRKTPYINHPLGVADLLRKAGVTDADVLIAAMFHDLVEDTDVTLKEIADRFGERIAGIVAEVTDNKADKKHVRKLDQIKNAPHKSHEAKCVKLADKLNNLSDIVNSPPKSWDPKRVQGYILWAEAVIAGLRGTNAWLEAQLDEIFEIAAITLIGKDGRRIPAMPPKEEREAALAAYIEQMEAQDEVDRELQKLGVKYYMRTVGATGAQGPPGLQEQEQDE
jgi:(p)ppGpp synthase/HD superfamily hydrolase